MSHLQWRYSLLEQYFDILRDFRVLYIAVSFLQQKLYIGGFDVKYINSRKSGQCRRQSGMRQYGKESGGIQGGAGMDTEDHMQRVF